MDDRIAVQYIFRDNKLPRRSNCDVAPQLQGASIVLMAGDVTLWIEPGEPQRSTACIQWLDFQEVPHTKSRKEISDIVNK
jgi:hypothetical protein